MEYTILNSLFSLFLPDQLTVQLCCVFWALIALFFLFLFPFHSHTSITLHCSFPSLNSSSKHSGVKMMFWLSDARVQSNMLLRVIWEHGERSQSCSEEKAWRQSLLGKGRKTQNPTQGKRCHLDLNFWLAPLTPRWAALTTRSHTHERCGSVDVVCEGMVQRDSWPQCYTLSNTAKINSSQ